MRHTIGFSLIALLAAFSACSGDDATNPAGPDLQRDAGTVVVDGDGDGGAADAAPEEPVPAYPDLGPSAWKPVGELWSDPATWGGVVPADGAKVIIARGKTVVVDVDVRPGSVEIAGTLLCGANDSSITTASILVTGTFACGSEAAPMSNRFVVTMTGERPTDPTIGMGTKVIAAMGTGTIEMHGKPRTSWVRISGNAPAGARTLVLDRATDWRRGDRIVIASTDFDMNQAEERAVASVVGTTVTLDRPLMFLHWGTTQTVTNGTRTWKLEERAEVALLDHPIVFRGDDASVASGYGAHLMMMAGTTLHLDNVELTRMGQRDVLARYPIHWHLAGNIAGQYVKGSSVHHTYNRCITVHGADNGLLQSNVCYDNPGHAIFLEDGVERGNVIEDNLGLVTRRPAKGLRVSDTARRGPDALGPATFWIGNPDNHVRRNVSAGSDGSGFWYGVAAAPGGPSAGVKINPSTTPLTEFKSNVAHSTGGMAIVIGAPKDDGETQHLYEPTSLAVFQSTTYYKTRARGVWAHGSNMKFDDLIAADNVRGAFFSYGSQLTNSVVVGESDNTGTPVSILELATGRSLADPKDGTVAGYLFYDGPVTFDGVHFAGFGRASSSVYVFANNGAALQSMDNKLQRITFAADTRNVFPPAFDFGDAGGAYQGAFVDVDGTVSGKKGYLVLPNIPINRGAACAAGPWTSPLWFACSPATTFRILLFTPRFAAAVAAPVAATITRSDGATQLLTNAGTARYQLPVMVNQSLRYRFQFAQAPTGGTLQLVGEKAGEDVVVELVGADLTAGAPAAASLADLVAGASGRAFKQGASLFVKLGSTAIGIQ